jgi:hypothetical protein
MTVVVILKKTTAEIAATQVKTTIKKHHQKDH